MQPPALWKREAKEDIPMGVSLNPSTLLSGDGIDVSTVVTQVMNQKSGQLTEWASEQTTLQMQAGLLKSMNTDLTSLADAMTALSDPLGALTAQAAISSNTSVLSATADTSATAGIHSVVVNNLASNGLVYTDVVAGGADSSILPSDTTSSDLQIRVGGTNGTTADIQITAGVNDTLNTLAASINQQSIAKKWGISASVVSDANGARLSITSQASGTPGALAIANNTTLMKFNAPIGGANASLTIDGIPYSSTTNKISGAITGVTLDLSNSSPSSAVQVTVGPDTQKVMQAINNFVSAYNSVVGDINTQYAVDPATDSEGPLGSDSSVRSLQTILMNDATYSITGNSGLVNLASLGINMNNDGTLTVGTTPSGQTTSQVLAANPTAFQTLFQDSTLYRFCEQISYRSAEPDGPDAGPAQC